MPSDRAQGPVVYTVGYQNGWDLHTLAKIAQEKVAVIVDARFKPMSRDPEWRRPRMIRILGDLYVHEVGLGNVNYKSDGPIVLNDVAGAIERLARLVDSGKSLILLCACRQWSTCHRTQAAAALAGAWNLNIINLGSAADELTTPLFE